MDYNPFDGMKKPNGSTPRERVLSDDEIIKVWSDLRTALSKSPACQRIVKLCLVTGQRVGEVSGLETAELNLDARTWIIPGARTKNGHKHVVPLSDVAIEIIRQALANAGTDAEFVFPNKDSMGRYRRSSSPKRSCARRNASGSHTGQRMICGAQRRPAWRRLGVAPIVRGHILNHRTITKAGVTLGVYDQYDYAKEKREALDLWAS